jgi:1-acyl-sn-glycerol-3-phosphate acyltransferase
VAYGDFAWKTSRLWLAPISRLLLRGRAYGLERLPPTGGCVLAITHLAWVDIPLVGALSPRNLNYVAKVEVEELPIGFGRFLDWHGIIRVRRGQSDREAVRAMRQAARDGRVVGLFVEGTRQRSGVPGEAKPGAAMVSLQENVPVVPVGVYGTQFWKLTNGAPCSIAFGKPVSFGDLPRNGRGYREATTEIERRIRVLYDWLADVHARGRPRGETPPL